MQIPPNFPKKPCPSLTQRLLHIALGQTPHLRLGSHAVLGADDNVRKRHLVQRRRHARQGVGPLPGRRRGLLNLFGYARFGNLRAVLVCDFPGTGLIQDTVHRHPLKIARGHQLDFKMHRMVNRPQKTNQPRQLPALVFCVRNIDKYNLTVSFSKVASMDSIPYAVLCVSLSSRCVFFSSSSAPESMFCSIF